MTLSPVGGDLVPPPPNVVPGSSYDGRATADYELHPFAIPPTPTGAPAVSTLPLFLSSHYLFTELPRVPRSGVSRPKGTRALFANLNASAHRAVPASEAGWGLGAQGRTDSKWGGPPGLGPCRPVRPFALGRTGGTGLVHETSMWTIDTPCRGPWTCKSGKVDSMIGPDAFSSVLPHCLSVLSPTALSSADLITQECWTVYGPTTPRPTELTTLAKDPHPTWASKKTALHFDLLCSSIHNSGLLQVLQSFDAFNGMSQTQGS
ncbi:uncharacterized protein N7482_003431 [Penicillium canariense]|uniref:Uncharacterized protein n=1 Tax=Penicillium canariense TaxID=189055 RepID=A0A9W9IAC8_9EURO|nr:uncharacterized protein N7482_003431 [Penicillium canariense]KAJ5167837.1 hypothetical protein N7482_003431 [Penicillium canariense]